MPKRKRRSMEAPLARGVARVTVPAPIELLKPPPLTCEGGCSSVVPWTVTFDVPDQRVGRSEVTTAAVDVRGLKSAMPLGAGKVLKSMIRKRRRVTFPPVLLVKVRRTSRVPKVELFTGSLVKSRTKLGGLKMPTQV